MVLSSLQPQVMKKLLPVVDLHCDLLSYLSGVGETDLFDYRDIGCAVPHLRSGNVKLQVMAVYSGGGSNSIRHTESQCNCFINLLINFGDSFYLASAADMNSRALRSPGIGILVAVENASALGDNNEPMDTVLGRLNMIVNDIGPIFYISLTHDGENRFGGGRNSSVGLKNDGKILLDYIDGKKIAVDLSHASDALACEIVDYITGRSLNIPIIASHSNFRSDHDHKRNLPDELARAVVDRKGLIGINFLRALLHPDNPGSLIKHILYGIEIGAQDALCFGADFFYTEGHPDRSRVPFFFEEHRNAGRYQQILQSLDHNLQPIQIEQLAYGNAVNFINRLWSGGQDIVKK